MCTPTRRTLLRSLTAIGAALAVAPAALARSLMNSMRVLVNDVHSKLNPTYVTNVIDINDVDQLRNTILAARDADQVICVAGGRHAMGGQQFATHATLLDTRSLSQIISFDRDNGLIKVEAGIQWPQLIDYLVKNQQESDRPWAIAQKQTGADNLTIGGALSSNIHGRGLTLKPIIADVESFNLMNANGQLITCSRSESAELFKLAIGGYGLFGIITSVTLRLMRRTKVQRIVEITEGDNLIDKMHDRIENGFLYGDCQFSIDPADDRFLSRGVLSCYQPVDAPTTIPEELKRLDIRAWNQLAVLAHEDPASAFDVYATYYLTTNGQVYWSDTHQLSTYLDDYHEAVDRLTKADWPGSEMITEVYVPRDKLAPFMDQLAEDFRRHAVKVVYGTIRLIEKDDESFLSWARESFACIVLNLHVSKSPQGIVKAATDFRRIIDRAIEHEGSYYLTYHRWASRAQVEACYPQMPDFLKLKRKYDPEGRFQSDWYNHHRRMFA